MAARNTRGPGPLEIVTTKPAGDVDCLADDIEARHAARLHGPLVQFTGIDSTEHDLGLPVAGRAGRPQRPLVDPSGQVAQ